MRIRRCTCHFAGDDFVWARPERKASQKGLRPWCKKSEIGLCQSATQQHIDRPTDVHRNNCMERNGKSRVIDSDRTRQGHSLNIPKPGGFRVSGPVSLRNGLICLIRRTTIQDPSYLGATHRPPGTLHNKRLNLMALWSNGLCIEQKIRDARLGQLNQDLTENLIKARADLYANIERAWNLAMTRSRWTTAMTARQT